MGNEQTTAGAPPGMVSVQPFYYPTQTILHIERKEGPEYRDSIEIGTPKTGVIKVYHDASDPEGFERKLNVMIALRERALQKLEGGKPDG